MAATAGPVTSAGAESAADARAQAERAAAVVTALEPQVARALAQYDAALQLVGRATGSRISAEAFADASGEVADARRRAAHQRVRALYMSGGPVALWASVLDAGTGTDALRRVADVEHVVSSADRADAVVADEAGALRGAVTDADAGVAAAQAGAAQVEARLGALDALLEQSQQALAGLSARAGRLATAEAAAAVLRAQELAAAAVQAARVSRAQAWPVPASWSALYRGAASTCPGLPWAVLAAIGQVETGHGRTSAVSSAGAMGPMQFMPATFAAYGVDGDGDGRAEITDPADSVYSAAHYLCANGGGRGSGALANAIWHYNHADWYVAMVLRIAERLAADPSLVP